MHRSLSTGLWQVELDWTEASDQTISLNETTGATMTDNREPATNDEHADRKKRMTAAQKMAATAGALAALVPVADAQADIVYVEGFVGQDLFAGNGSSADWDIDGDGPAEFDLRVRSSFFSNNSGTGTYSNVQYNVINFASRRTYGLQLNGRGLVGPGGNGVSNLNSGVMVGPTLAGYQWGLSNQSYRSALRYDYQRAVVSSSTVFSSTNFQIGADFNGFSGTFDSGFIGFRFEINGELHYGWAEINFAGDEMSITRWAYEDVAGVGLRVGQTSSVPEPGTLGLLGLGAAGVLAMRRRKKVREQK